MSVILDSDLAERNTRFDPDEIHAAIICETNFDFMKDEALCKDHATKIYDSQIEKMSN